MQNARTPRRQEKHRQNFCSFFLGVSASWRLHLLLCLLIVSPCIAAPATTQATEELPQPTLVTLKLDRTPVIEALRELFRQAEIPADWLENQGFAQQMADVTATGNYEKRPFTEVLLDLSRQCWLEPQYSPMPAQPMVLAVRRGRQPGTVRQPATSRASTRPTTQRTGGVVVYRTRPRAGLTPRPPGTTQPSWVDGPSFTSGPFVFVASDTKRLSRVDLEGNGASEPAQTMTLSLMVLRDPKVKVFAISDRLDVEVAKDEAGHSLLLPPPPDSGPRRQRAVIESRWNTWTLNVPLVYTEQSKKLALLRGKLNVTLITRTEPYDIIRKGEAVSGDKTIGDIRFSIGKLEPAGDSPRLGITIFRPGEGEQSRWDEVRAVARSDLFRINDSTTSAGYWLEAQMHSFINNSEARGVIQIHPLRTRNAPKAEKIDKLTWTVPTEFQEFSIPVEFKDLTLP